MVNRVYKLIVIRRVILIMKKILFGVFVKNIFIERLEGMCGG